MNDKQQKVRFTFNWNWKCLRPFNSNVFPTVSKVTQCFRIEGGSWGFCPIRFLIYFFYISALLGWGMPWLKYLHIFRSHPVYSLLWNWMQKIEPVVELIIWNCYITFFRKPFFLDSKAKSGTYNGLYQRRIQGYYIPWFRNVCDKKMRNSS